VDANLPGVLPHINTTAACVLGLLQLGPAPGARASAADGMTGWDIHTAASVSVARFWSITRSQVYRELATLAEMRLVEPVATTEPGERQPRDRQPYRITPAGAEVFERWLLDWIDRGARPEQLRSPLMLAVFFGDFAPPEKLDRLLAETALQHARAAERLEAMSAHVRDQTRPPALTLRRGVAYQRLMVDWIEDVRRAVGDR
jgi:DNA-binding PadR family transcriptional regulator